MKYRKEGTDYVIRLEKGEEVMEAMKRFAEACGVRCGSVTGIGATNSAVLGVYDPVEKVYHQKTYAADMEILSLTGNLSEKDGEAYVHLHAVVADESGLAKGGHVLSMRISLTGEIFVREMKEPLKREPDGTLGINLIQP